MMKCVILAVGIFSLLLGGCAGVQVGGGKDAPAYGSAGPAGSTGSVELRHCSAPVATVSISSQQPMYFAQYYGVQGDPTVAMRLIAQQSGCFRIVNRDVAMQTMNTERALQQQGELRNKSFGKGQVIGADYVVMVEVPVNNANSGGVGGAVAGAALSYIPYVGVFAGMLAGGVHTQEAQVMLTLVDNHTTEQLTTAMGKASGTSFSLGGGGLGFGGGGAMGGMAGGYANTDQGKVVMGAMIDALNHLVPQLEALPRSH
jgi:curli biogenesis system outer membrane secretion channel CsgG